MYWVVQWKIGYRRRYPHPLQHLGSMLGHGNIHLNHKMCSVRLQQCSQYSSLKKRQNPDVHLRQNLVFASPIVHAMWDVFFEKALARWQMMHTPDHTGYIPVMFQQKARRENWVKSLKCYALWRWALPGLSMSLKHKDSALGIISHDRIIVWGGVCSPAQ